MQAEVIAIGDELTSGQRLDTNSQWISQRLGELGVPVAFHTTVGDDLESSCRVFREAIRRADVVVCTGGLGPTADDLTRDALAAATGNPLILDEGVLDQIRGLFSRRGRTMPERNRVQAMFPEGSRVVPNPHGTAPGIQMRVPREMDSSSCRILALPGVPSEMREMWWETVGPLLRQVSGQVKVIRHRRIKCFGVGESDLEQMLPDLIRRGRQPSVGITVSKATITLRITAHGDSVESCEALMAPTVTTIHDCLGNLVFGAEDDELQHAVVRLLDDRKATLAVAEWGSGGLISQWLSDVDPAAQVFCGSVIVRDQERGSDILDRELVTRHGSSSKEVAAELARRCRNYFRTDFGLAVSDFPAADSPTRTAERVAFAVATDELVATRASLYAGHPDILKVRTAKQALDLLRLRLLDYRNA